MRFEDFMVNSYSVWQRGGRFNIQESIYGRKYIVREADATEFYDVFDNPEELAMDALRTALTVLEAKSEGSVRESILKFISQYGFLGLINVLPRTSRFLEQKTVYFPKNNIIKAESMKTQEYLSIFFPFKKPKYTWLHPEGKPLMPDLNETLYMMPEYAEPYDWVVQIFKDWAYMLIAVNDFRFINERNSAQEIYLRRRTFRNFDAPMPNYMIEYDGKPTFMWNFTSLWQAADILIKVRLTNPVTTICICPRCLKPFKTPWMNLYQVRDLCCKDCMEKETELRAEA